MLVLGLAVIVGACGGVAPTASVESPAATAGPGCTPSPVQPSPVPTPPSPAATTPSPSPMPSATARPSPSPRASAPPAATHVIRIVLSKQRLTAYEGSRAVLSTDVATGRPDLPTPTGHFHVLDKHSPYLFVSPWPKGSPYYYDPTWVRWAMLFAAGGYYMHDAPWQRHWGAGANVTSGSHGCVNVQSAAMQRLYAWARVGDDVIVTRT